jgi:hypothetical protein
VSLKLCLFFDNGRHWFMLYVVKYSESFVIISQVGETDDLCIS